MKISYVLYEDMHQIHIEYENWKDEFITMPAQKDCYDILDIDFTEVDMHYFCDMYWIKQAKDYVSLCNTLDDEDISYFYISHNKDDILLAILNQREIASVLWLRYFFIKDIYTYIATY